MAGHGLRRSHRCQGSALTPVRDACEVRKGVSSAGSQGADGCGRMQTCADGCGRVPDTLVSGHLSQQWSPMIVNGRQWSPLVANGSEVALQARRHTSAQLADRTVPSDPASRSDTTSV